MRREPGDRVAELGSGLRDAFAKAEKEKEKVALVF